MTELEKCLKTMREAICELQDKVADLEEYKWIPERDDLENYLLQIEEKYWRSKDGTKLQVHQMKNTHVKNIVNWLNERGIL